MYNNVDDQAFRGQPQALRDFPESVAKEKKESSHVYTLARLGSSSLKILLAICDSFPDKLQSLEIASMVDLHRSTISKYTNELAQLELIEQSVLPGTENKQKPTYLFRLASKIEQEEIRDFVKRKGIDNLPQQQINLLAANEELHLLEAIQEESGSLPSKDLNPEDYINVHSKIGSNELLDQKPLKEYAPEENQEEVIFYRESQSFESRVGMVLTQMATEIAALKNRVAHLEQQLEQKPQNVDTFDFNQVLSILEPTQNNKGTK
ncbi:MAG: hypothetical protein WBG73_22820 [Coleofasciculaceae cyanobacterium]